MARVIFNGTPGEVWKNEGTRVQYQLFVAFNFSCGLCIQFANAIAGAWPVPFHRNCRCRVKPIWPGADAEPYVDFMDEIRKLDPKQQAAAVGASNWKLLEKGTVNWDDVVTPTRVRDLREVVSRNKLSVADLTKAGVPRGLADLVHASVDTPAHELVDKTRQELVDKLKDVGLSHQEIKRAVGEGLAKRVFIGEGPSGAQSFYIAPRPLAPEVLGKILNLKPEAVKAAAPKSPEPAGTPVSRALDLDLAGESLAFREEIKATIEAVDRIHGDGPLPKIVVDTNVPAGADGVFRRIVTTGEAVEIAVRRLSSTPGFSLAHELGHFLERSGIPRKLGLANPRDWQDDEHLGDWYKAVLASPPIKKLKELVSKKTIEVEKADGTKETQPLDKDYLAYLRDPEEVWARAYSQWIASRSGNARLRGQLDAERREPIKKAIPHQWSDEEFKPIAQEIEALFTKLGWIKKSTTRNTSGN
jgi:hypothetical protein